MARLALLAYISRPLLVFILFVVIAHSPSQCQSINFSVKLVSAGADSILLEILDDNVTAINYEIKYGLKADATEVSEALGSLENPVPIRMITNPLSLIQKDEEEKKELGDVEFNYDDQDDPYGEQFPFEKTKDIKKKSYAEIHRFSIGDLDADRNYEITLTITARLAHLQKKIVKSNTTNTAEETENTETTAKSSVAEELKTTVKTFVIKFKTLADIAAEAHEACEYFRRAQASLSEPSAELYDSDDPYSSCYTETSNCTECKATCFQLVMNGSSIVRVSTTQSSPGSTARSSSKPILCEPCPCDTIKSTGECIVLDQSVIKCKKCLEPYTGLLCKECKNEGIDFYKNDQGECMQCNCNGNSAYDVFGSTQGKKLLKCQAGTGICIDCQFNTTGRHCHECRAGFIGDPMRRNCIPRKTINMSINFAKIKATQINYLNEKYNYKSLLLLSAYIFIILTLILVAYFVIRMKYRHHVVLKHGPHESCIVNTAYMVSECFSNMYESTRPYRARLAFHITWLCPSLVNRLRSAHIIPSGRSGNCGGGSGGHGLGNLNGFSNLNEDDRLNLAENQVFDDGLLMDDPFRASVREHVNDNTVNPFEDGADVSMGSSKNPYISLTSSRT